MFPLQTHSLSLTPHREGRRPTYVVRHLRPDQVEKIACRGKEKGSTINDLMAAAFLTALVHVGRWDGSSELRIGTTVDLRRHYLPGGRAGGICNLSAFEFLHPARESGHDFQSVLKAVTQITRARKEDFLGLNAYVGLMPVLQLLPYGLGARMVCRLFASAEEKGNQANVITNMGPLDPSDLAFDAPPVSAWILVPPMYGPVFGVGLTGYGGGLTLSCGIYAPEKDAGTVESVFDAMLDALHSL